MRILSLALKCLFGREVETIDCESINEGFKSPKRRYMGSHVPRLARLPCKKYVESSILFESTNRAEEILDPVYRFPDGMVYIVDSKPTAERIESSNLLESTKPN